VARLTGRHRAFVEFERALLQGGGARRVACVSEGVARELGEDFPASRDRLTVVENGVDLDAFHPRERERRGAGLRRELSVGNGVLLAFAARQPVLKGLPVLLAALARLQGLKWTLIVAGARDAKGWEERASREGVEPGRLRIVREAESVALFSAADLCVLPTWRDTSGLVLLESLACGTPVVTTARAGAADVVGRDAGAVVANAGDVEGLASALATWMERVNGGVDREAVRACVEGRGLGAWMERLEALLVELAG
jgi:glycosyltransferase involved in cell wall biosynthesis